MTRLVGNFWKMTRLAGVIAVFALSTLGSVAADHTGDPSCTGSLANQLNTVGQTGRVARFFSTLRAAPASDTIIAWIVTPAEFVVAAPPDGGSPVRCATSHGEDLWFVYIQYTSEPYAGLQGWANESQIHSQYGRDLYWIEPYTPAPVEPDCSASLPNQLNTVGQTGEIAERFSTLRTSPGGDGFRVHAPASFVVAAPPDGGESVRCVNGLVYVYIQYTDGEAAGQAGWAAESERVSIYGYDRYWIVPSS